MNRICLQIRVELLSDTIISSGHSIPGGEDISLRLDAFGRPLLPGSTLKGLLRESMEDLLVWEGSEDATLLPALFGEAGNSVDDGRRLVFGMLRLCGEHALTGLRAFTELTEDRVTKPNSLRVASCLRRGLCFSGQLYCAEEDRQRVSDGLRAIKWIGLHRNRGFGRVRITVSEASRTVLQAVAAAACLHYRLRLETPLTVGYEQGSGSREESKNYLETLRYLPGSTIRGYVISRLAAEDPDWFSVHRRELLGSVRFLNALPAVEGKSSIPTPAGFYEDKSGKKPIYSVLLKDVNPGDKRARMGAFCVPEGQTLCCASPRTSTAMRILRGEVQQIFNSRAMAEGTELDGFILLENPGLAQKISEMLCGAVSLGADRYAGSGLCSVICLEKVDELPWFRSSAADADYDNELYMELLAPTLLFRDGEPTDMDETLLAEKLGVSRVSIERCATSVTEVHGYNRTLGVNLPVLPMYAPGSVFRLRCDPKPEREALRRLEWNGIGIKRNEGCGQLLFLHAYPGIQRFRDAAPSFEKKTAQDAEYRQKRANWLLKKADKLPRELSPSQIGSIQTVCEQASNDKRGKVLLDEFFEKKAKTAREEPAYKEMKSLIDEVLNAPLSKTLACEAPKDSVSLRFELLIDLMDLSRKGDDRK